MAARDPAPRVTGDTVTSESTLFWKLVIPPTRFRGNFCDSVTRHFESEPEPCSRQDHRWKCSFTEHMINGAASVDIEMQRIKVSSGPELQQTQTPGGGDDQPASAVGGSNCQTQEHESVRAPQEAQSPATPHSRQERVRIRGVETWQAIESAHEARQHAENEINRPESPFNLRPQEHSSPSPRTQSHDQPLQIQENNNSETSPSSSDRFGLQRPIPPRIHYKTIALHTPKHLAPIMSMFLDNAAKGDIPIRVELDADVIMYRHLFQFEIVLSEEISSYQTPSPSGCHRILDSMFHEIMPTAVPNSATADVWFEFYPEADDVDENGGRGANGEAVAIVGAHEEVLSKFRYFAEWIRRERHAQEERRHQQVKEEWRIHERELEKQHMLWLQQQHQPAFGYAAEADEGGADNDEIMEQGQSWYYYPHPPPPVPELHRQSLPPPYPYPCPDPHPQPTYPYHSLGGQSFQSYGSSVSLSPMPINMLPVPYVPASQSPSFRAQQPLPTLRIPVKNMSLGTFQALLQYLYSGQIGISAQQLADIELYWNSNPEDYQLPREESDSNNSNNDNDNDHPQPPLTTGNLTVYHYDDGAHIQGDGNREEPPATPIILPPLKPASRNRSTGQIAMAEDNGFSSPRCSFTAPLYAGWKRPYGSVPAVIASSPVYAFTSASALSSWLPCARRNRDRCNHEQQLLQASKNNQQPRVVDDDGEHPDSEHHPQRYRDDGRLPQGLEPRHARSCCSWENLLVAATLCSLAGLRQLAIKAMQYHCQMMSIRASINNNVMAEVSHNGFDEAKLDLQLALGSQVLRSFLRLYKSPVLREICEGLLETEGEVEAGIGEGTSASGSAGLEEMVSATEIEPAGGHGPKEMMQQVEIKQEEQEEQEMELQAMELEEGEKGEQEQQAQEGMAQEQGHPVHKRSQTELAYKLFEEAECEEALIELCTELRERYLSLREIIQGSRE